MFREPAGVKPKFRNIPSRMVYGKEIYIAPNKNSKSITRGAGYEDTDKSDKPPEHFPSLNTGSGIHADWVGKLALQEVDEQKPRWSGP